ncbi:MAG: nucleoside diphosphate kinase regulator [Melioribacteraceae bacterium]|nr:nucleoside diphosphate kinase regulator [Melioribacteraceae bacterium]
MNKQIYITDFDMKRFKWLSSNSHKFDDMYKKHVYDLEMELKNAVIVEPKDIPSDVVTMNSKFRIKDLETNEETVYTLVFPFDADLEQNKLSILAPIGVAVIGYKLGDIIEWDVPAGKRRIKIEEILYQPEREGNYYI